MIEPSNRRDTNYLITMLHHPTRRQFLKLLSEHADPISPQEAAKMLDVPLSNLSYHVRVLAKHKVIALDRTEPIRGSTKHFYVIDPAIAQLRWVRESLGLR